MADKKQDQNRSTDGNKDQNPDPITEAPGSHPVATGVGAAGIGTAATVVGAALGGPIGAAIGAVAGAVAGGYAGKATGEAIDPTEDERYWQENYRNRPYVKQGESYDQWAPAYRYGREASQKYQGRTFAEVEQDLRRDFESNNPDRSKLDWNRHRAAVGDAFDRTIQLREERLHVDKERVSAGEVNIRKEIITEQRTIDVPVEREELVIERRPVADESAETIDASSQTETIRVPLTEEQVNVTKDAVVKEEVRVGKRKVTDTRRVEGEVRREELRTDGDTKNTNPDQSGSGNRSNQSQRNDV